MHQPEIEKKILEFWRKNNIFQKSLDKPAPKGEYVFYDGPPFATGSPHYGHIVASLIKDMAPRYFTMAGFHAARRWGWDCHGLPIENIVEQERGFKRKKDIIAYGIDKFNEDARSKVLEYADEWRAVIDRLGRWVDMDNAYRTMDREYMESVWWVFKQLWDKGLIYEGFRSLRICPRCETTLSQSEVSEGYKEVEDLSVAVKFPLLSNLSPEALAKGEEGLGVVGGVKKEALSGPDRPDRQNELYHIIAGDAPVYLLAWTTTPWTLPGNAALAVRDDIEYVIIKTTKKEALGMGSFSGLDPLVRQDELTPSINISKAKLFVNSAIVENQNRSEGGPEGNRTPQGAVSIRPATPVAGPNSQDRQNELYHENVVLAKTIFEKWREEGKITGEVAATVKGKDLIGLEYEPLFSPPARPVRRSLLSPEALAKGDGGGGGGDQGGEGEEEKWRNAFKVYSTDFVNTEEGTGIAHIAPAFGEDDMNLGKRENLPFIQHVKMDGTLAFGEKHQNPNFQTDAILNELDGLEVKPKDDPAGTDKKIVAYLEKRGLLFSQELYRHSYPHCWRCESPLLNYSASSYFVAVAKIKEQLLSQAEDIRWAPEHIKQGRFGNWLANARDWSISRQRFWGSAIPIWICDKNKRHQTVIGGAAELTKLSGKKIKDLHKHFVDKIVFKCDKCGGVMRRVPDVLDCWFESGAMPYCQMHYPFENEKKFKDNFPAQFIAEGVDQTRAWFYYLHVMAVAIMGKPAFKNVVVSGIVLAEDGQKMSKRLRNYPDPMMMFDKYGADAVRYYLAAAPVMRAEDLNFSENGVSEAVKKVLLPLHNVLAFYKMCAEDKHQTPPLRQGYGGQAKTKHQKITNNQFPITNFHILDRWILSKLNVLIRDITAAHEAYDLNRAVRPLGEFINELSTWYVRRSRGRFKGEDAKDKSAALATLGFVLSELSKLMAPVMPFTAEHLWQEVQNNQNSKHAVSAHLEDWPAAGEIDEQLLGEMEKTRQFAETIHSLRAQVGIKVRQPLAQAIINAELAPELGQILKEETNVQLINQSTNQPINQSTPWIVSEDGSAALNSALTKELRLEGHLRELTRQINALRKKRGLTPGDKIALSYQTKSEELKKVFGQFADELSRAVIASEIRERDNEGEEISVDGEKARICLLTKQKP